MFLKLACGVAVAGLTYLQRAKQGSSAVHSERGKTPGYQCGVIRAQDVGNGHYEAKAAASTQSSSAPTSHRSAAVQGRELLAKACAKETFTDYFVRLEEDRQLDMFRIEILKILQQDEEPCISSDSETDSCSDDGW